MSIVNNPAQWQTHWDYARSGMGMVYPRFSPLHWRDFAPAAAHRGGLGMIFPCNQKWRTSDNFFSLALKNTENTGVSFDTPSGGIAERKRWASAGFRGYGPVMTFPGGAGMDGMGCGCGCGGGDGGMMTGLLCFAGAAAALWFLRDKF